MENLLQPEKLFLFVLLPESSAPHVDPREVNVGTFKPTGRRNVNFHILKKRFLDPFVLLIWVKIKSIGISLMGEPELFILMDLLFHRREIVVSVGFIRSSIKGP